MESFRLKSEGEKEIYFIVLYKRKEIEKQNDSFFKNNNCDIQNIYNKNDFSQNEGLYFYKKVFKLFIKLDNNPKKNKINMSFVIGGKTYTISFIIDEKSFYYDIILTKEYNFLPILTKSNEDQNIINYFQKLEIFIAALKENKEEEKIDNLYEETIKLYSKKKGFYLLISLFVNIYDKKNLCIQLTEEFKKMNKENKNEKNMDRDPDLKIYLSAINKIISDADNIIKTNQYNPINIYGVLLSYLNYYDYENFKKYFSKLYKESSDTLYEILIIYYSNILNPLNQDIRFFENFINYIIKNKEFNIFENSLNYILDIESFIDIINKKKEIIFKKYGDSNFKTIKIKSNLEIKKEGKGKEIENIIAIIESIIDFSRNKKKLLIYFNSNFWLNILKHYKEPNAIHILGITICFNIRNTLEKYANLLDELFNNSKIDDEKKMKNDIKKFIDNDEYAKSIDNNIKFYFKNNKEITNEEIIGIIIEYHPYYIDDKYKNDPKRDSNIFDYIDFNHIDSKFIETFKKFKFEDVFQEKITSFTNKMISKIDNIYIFMNIIELIDINKISKDKSFLPKLKLKYDKFVKKINSLYGEKLNEIIKVIAIFSNYLFIQEKNLDFLEQKVDKLSKKIKPMVYNELMKICQKDVYKPIREYIYKKLLNNMDNIDNIIILIDSLSKDNKINFLKKLIKSCLFTRVEFYSNYKNSKILLLIKLYEKGKLEISIEDIDVELEQLLINLRNDIEGDIEKKTLETFLKNGKDVVIKRLQLIKIIFKEYNPEAVYEEKMRQIAEINNDINELNYIKNTLSIYHRYKYLETIREITNVIKDLKENSVKFYNKLETKDIIQYSKVQYKPICFQVDCVKDFILFNIIYDETSGNDQKERFKNALSKLDEIKDSILDNISAKLIYEKNKTTFNKIKDILKNNDSKANQLINQIKKYCNINKNTELINDLTIIFKSKKYEMDLKSIIYFFECYNPNDTNWNKNFPKGFEKLSTVDLEELKIILNELKENGIYNYNEKINYYKIFTSLYEKKEAIDFLISKKNLNITYLEDRIDPIIQNLTLKNIQDTDACIKIFNQFKDKDNFKIFNDIKKLGAEQIKKFESYSKNYSSIIELDRNDNIQYNLFEKVNKIIKDARLIFKQDDEEFNYGENKTNIDELIHLKNNIYIKPLEEIKAQNYQKKCNKLLFFKNIISELEIIYDNIKALRIKGSSLPIEIIIEIKYPYKKYLLNNIEKNFKEIKEFLFSAKVEQISQLDIIYRKNKYLRFLYGKLFRKVIKHLEDESNVYEIERYILNMTGTKINLIDGEKCNAKKELDYVEQYKLYINNSFDNISDYIISLFRRNNLSLEKHYKKMLIKGEAKYKGFYLYKCDQEESMEELIFNIFIDKISKAPVAQNILFTNEGTSIEEIQAFFYRAILCDYNTLFVVEINDSFSEFQQNIMNYYIDSIIAYKNKIHNETEKKNIEKNKANLYLKSCIVFVYKHNNSFLRELEKFNIQEMAKIERKKQMSALKRTNTNTNNFEFRNIKIITSDICGLGKSYRIKQLILSKNKKYYYLTVGGILSKKILCEKLYALLKKIKDEQSEKIEKVAIHLDLKESSEISIINEFLFSFLITKFYINSESIIYIPKEIEIYIEISNSFENYYSKLNILKMFEVENIRINEIPKLDLQEKTIQIFNENFNINSNQQIEKFIKEHIGFENYSYHQIKIFITLIISQFTQFKSKLINYLEDKKEIKTFIKELSKFNTYYALKGYTKYLIEKFDNVEQMQDKNNYYFDIYEKELKPQIFDNPFLFSIIEKILIENINKSEKESTRYNYSKFYLKIMKEIFEIDNEIEVEKNDKKSLLSILEYKTQNYIITNDNFKKMLLLFYRIKANIPVIIMGETGCGKTLLIEKLYQILNNGKMNIKRIILHPGTTDEIIYKEMKNIIEKSEKIKEEIWILFDDINTSLSFSLLTEIFINRTYNGEIISDNIRLIGACNPYRKRKAFTEKFGFYRQEENENELVYLVNPLPQSLLYFVFNFGSINEEDEKKYIYNMIEKLFSEKEKELHEITKNAIFECHKYLRETFDPSIVSLRDISRFFKYVNFFENYFSKKYDYLNKKTNDKEKLFKIKSIICSIYLCYYIRLIDESARTQFDIRLKRILLKLVNSNKNNKEENKEADIENTKNEEYEEGSLIDNIKFEELKIDLRGQKISQFSDFVKAEEEFLINIIEIDKGIGKSNILKENLFLLFISIMSKIPLIMIGEPGTSKSLSADLLSKSLKGRYSKNEFFRLYPEIILTYFQGSESTNPEDIIKLFEMAEGKYNYFNEKLKKKEITKEDFPISMILFDELDLSEKSKTNPLKILHSKLESKDMNENISFIGISRYSLDAAKLNRFIVLSIQKSHIKIDQLLITSKAIIENISEDLYKNHKPIFDILVKTYYEYKNILYFIKELLVYKEMSSQKNTSEQLIDLTKFEFSEIKRMKKFKNLFKKEKTINIDFHGNGDLFNLIKGIAIEIGNLSISDHIEIKDIIEKYIERNFGGIDYEIDINFKLSFSEINQRIKSVYSILELSSNVKRRMERDNREKVKISSVFIFKKIYNKICDEEKEIQYKISNDNCRKYDLNKCINDNINDNCNSRYLLLGIKPSLSPLIYQIINIQNSNKSKIELYEGSPLFYDNNNEYKFKKINEIREDAKPEEKKNEKLIILQNLDQIHAYLYDMYYMNYKIKDEQKCTNIFLDNFRKILTPINELFRIIILVDRDNMDKIEKPLLNRFEKMKITFNELLNKEQILLTKGIIDEINLEYYIDNFKKSIIKYNLKDLLINCETEEIEGLIYNLDIEIKKKKNIININEEEIKEKLYNKIINLLPQDIIVILPERHIIRKIYYDKKYYNFYEYISDEENKCYKISIIYTFSSLSTVINGSNNEMSFIVSEIKNEDQLINKIDEMKNKNENQEKSNNIIVHFEHTNSNKIQFISNFIIKNFKEDKYNYILIIHINRNFNPNTNESIYSMPDINPIINQIFLDNLNSKNIKLQDFLDKNIIDILNDPEKIDLNREFKRALTSFVYKELFEKSTAVYNSDDEFNSLNEENYIDEITKYMDEEVDFKCKIIAKALDLINNDKVAQGTCKSLLEKILKNINKNSTDIISCLLDYIKEQIFSDYLIYIFKVLESNNFLTTLVENKKNNFERIDNDLIIQLEDKFINEINLNEKIYEPKFSFKFIIPGFYNFYEKISNYITRNIYVEFFNSEKNLRIYSSLNIDKEIINFKEKEEILLSNIYDEISKETFIFSIMNTILPDLILKDYITFFLEKYINSYSKTQLNNEIVHLLLNLRFNEKNEIMKCNIKEPLKIIFLKIIWIESNVNFISNIIKIIELSKQIFNDDGEKLFNNIKKLILDNCKKISYIFNEKRNPEYTKEVNECFYILLASICYCLTSDKIQLIISKSTWANDGVEINLYYRNLKEINIIMQNLNDDLLLFLNEMYIIDELIKVIELQKLQEIDIEKINIIRKYLRKSAEIIQSNQSDQINELISNLDDIYRELLIANEEAVIEKGNIYYDKYYDTLRYIFYKEIKKISNVNYRAKILEYLISEKEIIKKSNNIFQILFKQQIKVNKDFKRTRKNLLLSNDEYIKIIEKNLLDSEQDNFLSLTETLLYFFEKNSIIYFNNIYHDSKEEKDSLLMEKEPLDIFKDCINFLQEIIEINKKYERNNKYTTKLFCLAYIKIFCQIFIKMFEDDEAKFKEPQKIIDFLNEKKTMNKTIRLYIYKILFNKYQIDVFLNKNNILKYKLEEYEDFKVLLKFPEDERINFGFETLDNENYERIYKILENKKKDKFKNKIKKVEIGDNLNIDNFYIASSNLILFRLNRENFETSEFYIKFYENICQPLYENNKYFTLIQFLFNPKKYKEIKDKYNINSNNIEAVLYGYRYCINEFLSEERDDEIDNDYIFFSLYDKAKVCYLSEKYYPGSDIRKEPYLELYSEIKNIFIEKPNQCCFVCLCKTGFYYTIPLNSLEVQGEIKCCNCGEIIWNHFNKINREKELEIKHEIIKNDKYVILFKDEREIELLKKDEEKRENFEKINYMTLKSFEDKYIIPLYKKGKGLPSNIDKNFYLNDNKVIRNLSQISFRLLNYILYSHLFFARIFTNLESFDKYKPKEMSWGEIINQSFELLSNELSKKGIKSIEIFMNYIFKELFEKLHDKECINEYKELIEFEKDLENLIQEKIEKSIEEIKKYNKIIEINSIDNNSSLNLLKDKFEKDHKYKKEEYPNYEYFYYSDYLNENYIMDNKLKNNEVIKYPLLNKYLNYKKNIKTKENKYSLDKFNLFNKTLNLINEKYSHKITKEYAETTLLKDTDLYKNVENSKLIDKFIKFYNKLKLENNNGEEIKLNADKNYLSDFFIDNNNEIGKTYISIYKIFIKQQNNELNDLINIKINEGVFDYNSKNKINAQQIQEDEIFTFNKFSFVDVLYNNSYRIIIDTKNYNEYNLFKIDFPAIEENMTELLLKNKKLLDEELIIQFVYNYTIFDNQAKEANIIATFKKNYKAKELSSEEKIFIINFIKGNKDDLDKCKNIIKDFMSLIEHLNNIKKNKQENDSVVKGHTKIVDILKNFDFNTSNEFLTIFDEKNKFTINKVFEIFYNYLLIIFDEIKGEIRNYQENIEVSSENQLNEKSMEKLDEFFQKQNLINPEDLEIAIKLFITLVLFREKDKENKIKFNRKNIVDYLKQSDFWNDEIYSNEKFNENLEELKLYNIKINNIMMLYDFLVEKK